MGGLYLPGGLSALYEVLPRRRVSLPSIHLRMQRLVSRLIQFCCRSSRMERSRQSSQIGLDFVFELHASHAFHWTMKGLREVLLRLTQGEMDNAEQRQACRDNQISPQPDHPDAA